MSFVLKDAGLMGFVTGTAVKPVHDRNEKRPDRVDKKQEAIDIWLEKDSRAVGKLGKMCTRTVQSEFNDTWTAKQAWEALKERYTPVGWSSKWAVLNQLEEASYQNSSGIADMGRTMRTVLEEIHEQKITIDEYVTIKIINSLGPGFKTYVTVLNEQARKDKKLPDLDGLLKSLEEEELRTKTQDEASVYALHGRGKWSRRAKGVSE